MMRAINEEEKECGRGNGKRQGKGEGRRAKLFFVNEGREKPIAREKRNENLSVQSSRCHENIQHRRQLILSTTRP